MKFDDILKAIGEFGPYQKFIFLLMSLPNISTGLQKFVWVFLIAEPDHRCELLLDNLPDEKLTYSLPNDLLNKTVPYNSEKHQFDRCHRYSANVNATSVFGNWSVFREELSFTKNEETCSNWVFDNSEYTSTIVTEFHLVCASSWEQKNGQALFVAGELLAALTSGYISDRFGRRLVLLGGTFFHILFAFLTSCSPSHTVLIIFRTILGFSSACMYLTTFVIVMELIGPNKRLGAGVGINYFFSLGYLLVLPFAYFIRDWRFLQVAVTVPALGFLSYWWLVPESPRWLMSQNRYEDTKAILQKAAEKNTTTLPEGFTCIEPDDSVEESTATPLTLFRYPVLRQRTLISIYLWFVSSAVYYGLTLNSPDLGGNVYFNFLISALLEFPATAVCHVTLDKWGRRLVLSVSMFVAGVALVVTTAVPEDNFTVLITLAMIGKFAITMAFIIVYIVAGEVFPTVVRNTGLGICSSGARIGSMTAPYVALLGQYWKLLPLVLFGVEALIAGCLALLLPETMGKNLPETIQDGESFGRKEQPPVTVTVHDENGKDTAEKY